MEMMVIDLCICPVIRGIARKRVPGIAIYVLLISTGSKPVFKPVFKFAYKLLFGPLCLLTQLIGNVNEMGKPRHILTVLVGCPPPRLPLAAS